MKALLLKAQLRCSPYLRMAGHVMRIEDSEIIKQLLYGQMESEVNGREKVAKRSISDKISSERLVTSVSVARLSHLLKSLSFKEACSQATKTCSVRVENVKRLAQDHRLRKPAVSCVN